MSNREKKEVKEDEEFKDLYQGDFVYHEGEIELDTVDFKLFEIKILFNVFILLNSFQSAACILKISKVTLRLFGGE